MGRVIDVREAGADADVLTSTGSGGLFGGEYLAGAPLVDRLWPDEAVAFVVRNGDGVDVEGGDRAALSPDEDYQALAAVTDLRVFFVAGRAGGDEQLSVQLRDVVQARAESTGFRSSALVVETLNGVRYTFDCRGDVGPVAAYVDDAAGAWGTIEGRLDEAETAVDESLAAAEAGDYDRATDRLDAVESAFDVARDRAASLGPGAVATAEARVAAVRGRYRRARRRVFAGRGGVAHADAQAAWRDRDYETAAGRYETAVESYREALVASAPEPPDETLLRRARGAVREREILAIAPMMDADTARRRGDAADRPREAAESYETALDRYRDALGLDWGAEDRRFAVDRETVRERAAAVADAAVDAHRAAARRWRDTGDALALDGEVDAARELYERGHDRVERALDLAREVRPARVDRLEDDRDALADRLAGDRPDEGPEAVDLPDVDDFPDSVGVPASDRPAGDRSGTDDRSGAGGSSGVADADREAVTTGAGGGTSGRGLASSDDRGPPESGATTDADAFVRSSAGGSGDSVSETAVVNALRDLGAGEFTDLVARLWEARGWSTTAFPASASSVYDVLAVRDDDRTVLWTVHEPDGDVVPPAVVERCGRVRDGDGASDPVLVTDGTVPSATRERADDRGVSLVGPGDLADALRGTDLLDQLDL